MTEQKIERRVAIVDIDGTLADCTHRLHHIKGPDGKLAEPDWDAFHAELVHDEPVYEIIELVNLLYSGIGPGAQPWVILLVTGRMGTRRNRAATVDWLERHGVAYDHLFMRPKGDFRQDVEIKREILEDEIKGVWGKPALAIEDRARIAAMWREEGIRVLHVAEGDF